MNYKRRKNMGIEKAIKILKDEMDFTQRGDFCSALETALFCMEEIVERKKCKINEQKMKRKALLSGILYAITAVLCGVIMAFLLVMTHPNLTLNL